MVTTPVSAAECQPPEYQIGNLYEASDDLAALTISIRPADFAPARLVCLAGALKQRYKDSRVINAFVFSSADAAEQYSAPVGHQSPEYVRQLHAEYFYDAEHQEEHVDLKPLGTDLEGPYDTRIDLPVEGSPHCNFHMNARCLLAMGDIVYPGAAFAARISGTVTLTGGIGRDGVITNLQVTDVITLPSGSKDLLSSESISTLKSWRFEETPRQDLFRITFSYLIDSSMGYPGQVDVRLALPEQVTVRANPPN
jgi:hypothetical protein